MRSLLLSLILALSLPAWGATVTRTSSFEYDPDTGLLVKETIEPDQPQMRLDTTYTYDAFGNRTSATVSSPATGNAAIAARTTTTTYDGNGQFPVSVTNAVGHGETKVFDARLGVVTSLTGPNGLTTTWQYDGFGRKTRENRADGSYTVWTYDTCDAACPANAVYRIVTQVYSGTTQIAPASVVYYDPHNRALRTATQGFDGTWIYKDTVYDSQGRVEKVSRPYFAGQPVYWVTSEYDDLGRVVRVYEPDDPDTPALSVAYNGLTVSRTNRKGQVTTETRNSQGQKVSVTDAMGNVTTYAYDPFGNLIRTTDPAGNQIVNVYDLRGRKTQTTDPDLGLWKYEYNVLGELVKQTDAKGVVTTMSYDPLGRMLQRVVPGRTESWVYDTAANGKGKLYRARISTGYIRTHTYDTLGRPKSTQFNFGTGEPQLTSSVTYDAVGRAAQQTYPSGVSVKQVYNAWGYLAEVRNAGTNALYWRADQMDAEGHVLKETYGNGVVTERTYAADSGRIQNILGTNAGGTQIQAHAYVYDSIGNVTIVADAPNNQLEIRGGYDDLNRLTQVETYLNGVASTETITYNALGNITSKTGVGTYTYGDPLHRHAVTAVTGGPVNLSYSYDANGNLVSGAGRSITWTAWNMPASLTQGGQTQSWLYDPERNRYKLTATGRTTWYINPSVHQGGHYERTQYTSGTVEHRHTLYGGGKPIGEIVSFEGGAPAQTRYFHGDIQGSITAVTNEAGTVITRFRYDPWGKQTLVAGSNTGIDATRQGHTGHEMLDGGLTHMNGRLYDPVLARFVSADPYVDNPFDLQSLNRYSYVNNNPLGFTDPSGYFKLFGKKWSWWRDKVVKPVVAAWVGYYAYGFVGLHVGTTTGSVAAGVISGSVAAGATTSLIMNGNLNATWSYAANFAMGNYLTNMNYLQNPMDQFSSLGDMISTGNFGELRAAISGTVMNHQFSRAQARLADRWGMSSMDLNTAFMGVSVFGNNVVGTRFVSGTDANNSKEFPASNGIGFRGILNRGPLRGALGLPFDVIDIALGYQGLPTASFRDYAYSGLLGRPVSGHSLGTLDAINAHRLGMATGGGRLDSVPFGNVASTALQVNLGMGDLVNGGFLGKMFNPGARICSMGPTGHQLASYLKVCP